MSPTASKCNLYTNNNTNTSGREVYPIPVNTHLTTLTSALTSAPCSPCSTWSSSTSTRFSSWDEGPYVSLTRMDVDADVVFKYLLKFLP